MKAPGVTVFRKKPKKRRPGIVAKTKQTTNKRAKLYKKPKVGQG